MDVFYFVFISAFIIDGIIGDPRWLPHPIVLLGFIAKKAELATRRFFSNELVAGLITVVTLIVTLFCVLIFGLYFLHQISQILFYLISSFLLAQSIATRDLAVHSMNIYKEMVPVCDIVQAREKLGWIVGRETSQLSEEKVIKAAVESVAENLVDGVTAPIFFGILFSLFASSVDQAIGLAVVGAYTYKMINTMDSMFGYKNEKYYNFGKVAAKLDDAANYIPARITGWVIIACSMILSYNWKGALQVFKTDRLNHSSPNAGHPEAAFAGALGIELGGTSTYNGVEVQKPSIGVSINEISPSHILQANKLMFCSAILFFIMSLTLHYFIVVF